MKILKMNLDKFISLIMVGLAAGYLYGAKDLALGTLKSPGVGMVPTILGALWLIINLYILLRKDPNEYDTLDKESRTRLLKLALAVILYTFMICFIGFKISTFLIIMYASYLLGNRRPVKLLVFSLLTVIIASVIFETVLKLPLPEPILASFGL